MGAAASAGGAVLSVGRLGIVRAMAWSWEAPLIAQPPLAREGRSCLPHHHPAVPKTCKCTPSASCHLGDSPRCSECAGFPPRRPPHTYPWPGGPTAAQIAPNNTMQTAAVRQPMLGARRAGAPTTRRGGMVVCQASCMWGLWSPSLEVAGPRRSPAPAGRRAGGREVGWRASAAAAACRQRLGWPRSPTLGPPLCALQAGLPARKRPEYIPNRIDDPNYVREGWEQRVQPWPWGCGDGDATSRLLVGAMQLRRRPVSQLAAGSAVLL